MRFVSGSGLSVVSMVDCDTHVALANGRESAFMRLVASRVPGVAYFPPNFHYHGIGLGLELPHSAIAAFRGRPSAS